MKPSAFIASLFVLGTKALFAADPEPKLTSLKVADKGEPIVLKANDSVATVHSFKPPVEITLVAKTDSTNIRMGYAANQIIFNWELNPKQLRVDGGPADKKHKAGAGEIPIDQYVTIKWLVSSTKQAVYVDGKLRFEHEGNYAEIYRPVRVFTHQAKVTLKSLEVRPLAGK